MTEVSEGIWAGIGLVFVAAVMAIAVYFMQLSRQIGRAHDEENRLTDEAREYREFWQYDGKKLFQLDVAALVAESAGNLAVTADNPPLVWDALSPQTAFNLNYVTEHIPENAVYVCSVQRSANGTVTGFDLRRI